MTGSRLSSYVPGRLDDEQLAVYDAIAGGPRAAGPQDFPLRNPDGSLTGPFNALVAAGRLGAAVQAVGAELRYSGSLSDVERELAILLVGRHWDAAFELYAHERVARRVGVPEAVIAAVGRGDAPRLDDPRQQVVHDVVTELLGTTRLGADLHARASEVLGERALVELVLLVGYYTLLAQLLNAFDVGLPDDDDGATTPPGAPSPLADPG